MYGHRICCPGHSVYSGLGFITMGGRVLRLICFLSLFSPYAAGSNPNVSIALTAWCAGDRAFGLIVCFIFPVQDHVQHLESCAMRIWPGLPVGHPWVRQWDWGGGWGSSDYV